MFNTDPAEMYAVPIKHCIHGYKFMSYNRELTKCVDKTNTKIDNKHMDNITRFVVPLAESTLD